MNRNRWTLVAVGLATFMTYLDNNIVNVAIPDIQRELGLSMPAVESPSSRWMSGIATLTMLLSRYVMNVASPTATRVHRFRFMPRLLYVVHVWRTGNLVRRIVVKPYGV